MKKNKLHLKPYNGNERGVVLIVILGVLTLLVVLGTVFSMLTTLERSASKNHVDHVQAKLIAQSGIHYAISTARTYLRPDKIDQLKYYGEDLNGDGKVSDEEDVNKDGPQILNCPLARAARPSMMQDINKDGNIDDKDLIDIKKGKNNYKVGVSVRVPSQYNSDGDYFALKVDDLSSRLYINMEDHSHFKQILENLAEEIGLNKEIGTKIFDEKTQKGTYASIEDLKARVKLTDQQAKILEPYISFYSWWDETVVSPTPLSGRLGRDGVKPSTEEGKNNIESWSEMRIAEPVTFPKKGRAPVNINNASKELLVALIRDLKGFYLQALDANASNSDNYVINSEWTAPANYALHQFPKFSPLTTFKLKETTAFTKETAKKIAKEIGDNRPFRNWEQFHKLCDVWADKGFYEGGKLTKEEADVLKANFNPNTNLNDFNPDYNRLLRVDKTDLTYYTTEFTFYPTGYYEINSLGRILNNNNKVLAQAEVKTVVKLFDICRETTEKQFLADLKDKPIKNNIINESSTPTHNDLTLQVLPERNEKGYGDTTDYDGYITLATTEFRRDNIDNNPLRFRASFTAGLNPNIAYTGGDLVQSSNPFLPGAGALLPIKENPADKTISGRLYADGAYSDSKAVPAYNCTPQSLSNGKDQLMLVSMWVKPHFYPEETGKIRCYLSWMNPTTQNSRYTGYGVPFGIYSIARYKNNDVPPPAADGDGWNHNSFLAGGYGTNNAIWFTGAGTPCLNHIDTDTGHGNCSGRKNSPDWNTTKFRAGKWMNVMWVRRVSDPFQGSPAIKDDKPLKYALLGNKLYIFADGSSYQRERIDLAACPGRMQPPPQTLPPPSPVPPPTPPPAPPAPPAPPPAPPAPPAAPPAAPPEPPPAAPPAPTPTPTPAPTPTPTPTPAPSQPAWQGTNDRLYINGTAWSSGPFQDQNNPMIGGYNDSNNFLRLGEISEAPRLNGAPDATIDEVMIFELIPTQTGPVQPVAPVNPAPPSGPGGSIPSSPDRESVDNNTYIVDENIKLCSLSTKGGKDTKVTYITKEKIIWASCPHRMPLPPATPLPPGPIPPPTPPVTPPTPPPSTPTPPPPPPPPPVTPTPPPPPVTPPTPPAPVTPPTTPEPSTPVTPPTPPVTPPTPLPVIPPTTPPVIPPTPLPVIPPTPPVTPPTDEGTPPDGGTPQNGGTPATSGNPPGPMADVPPNIQDIYTTGRYYTGNDAEFTSREIDFNFERGLGTSGTDADPVNVFMVHWTVYGTKTTVDDGTMPNGKVDVELNSKTLTLPDNGAAVSPTATGQPFAPSDNKMRYKLLFKPTTNNQPAIDTIMLDDITFYYYATPKIVSWRYEQ